MLGIAACTAPSATPAPPDQPAPGSPATPTGLEMTMPRASHTATTLPDGRVLIAGGCTTDGCGGTPEGGRSEFYDPTVGRFTPGPNMVQARGGHTATRLGDGRVLYAGGYPDEGRPPLRSLEMFDPTTNQFTQVGQMTSGRGSHTATLLRDGRVLLVGGVDSRQALSTAEVFDPATNRVTRAASLPGPRATHVAGLLADGRVLVAGGQTLPGHGRGIVGTAALFDPARNAWSAVGDLQVARYKAAIAPLSGGGALVIGGQTADDAAARLPSTERFDPASNGFAAGPTMSEPRYKISDAVVVLRDGRVVVAGGFGVDVISGDEARPIGPPGTVERQFPAAAELMNGTVLVTGGYSERTRVTASAVLVRP